jgi:uncharacterized small protein (DUF1192 family)
MRMGAGAGSSGGSITVSAADVTAMQRRIASLEADIAELKAIAARSHK